MGLGIGSFTGKNIRTGVEKMALVSSNHWTSVEKGTLISSYLRTSIENKILVLPHLRTCIKNRTLVPSNLGTSVENMSLVTSNLRTSITLVPSHQWVYIYSDSFIGQEEWFSLLLIGHTAMILHVQCNVYTEYYSVKTCELEKTFFTSKFKIICIVHTWTCIYLNIIWLWI